MIVLISTAILTLFKKNKLPRQKPLTSLLVVFTWRKVVIQARQLAFDKVARLSPLIVQG